MHLKVVCIGLYEVYAVANGPNDCPLLEFLFGLGANLRKDRDRMLALLNTVAERGPSKNTEISHQIRGKIYEYIQGRLRIFWFYDEGKMIICTSGFVKDTRKTPRAELDAAEDLRKRYREAKKAGRLIFIKEEGA
jgi:phage-related protein